MTDRPKAISDDEADAAAQMFAAAATGARVKILFLMAEGPLRVKAIAEAAGMNQPAVSHNLKVMRLSGVVKGEARGKEHWYGPTEAGRALLAAARGTT